MFSSPCRLRAVLPCGRNVSGEYQVRCVEKYMLSRPARLQTPPRIIQIFPGSPNRSQIPGSTRRSSVRSWVMGRLMPLLTSKQVGQSSSQPNSHDRNFWPLLLRTHRKSLPSTRPEPSISASKLSPLRLICCLTRVISLVSTSLSPFASPKSR